MGNLEPFYSENFRTPLELEKRMGIWVDRIGSATQFYHHRPRLRYLGLFSAVSFDGGRGTFIRKGTPDVGLEPGDVVIVFPDIACHYFPTRSWKSNWISWAGPQPEAFMPISFNPSQPVIHGASDVVEAAFQALTPLMQRESADVFLERLHIIIDMVTKLKKLSSEGSRSSLTDRVMEEAIQDIRDGFDQPISVPELGRRFGYSETHFRRLFKTYTGRSPKEFVISERVSQAKSLLKQGVPMKEVCEQVGYEDVFYFMRVFKKVTGISPGAFK